MEKIQTKICSLILPDFIIGYEKKRLEVDAVSAFSSSTTQDTRANAQDWNTGPKRRKERDTFCERFGKWTSVLWARVQLHRIRDIAPKNQTFKSFAISNKKRNSQCCEFLFQFNWSRKIPYMVFLLIDFHASNDLFYIENMGNPSFLL